MVGTNRTPASPQPASPGPSATGHPTPTPQPMQPIDLNDLPVSDKDIQRALDEAHQAADNSVRALNKALQDTAKAKQAIQKAQQDFSDAFRKVFLPPHASP